MPREGRKPEAAYAAQQGISEADALQKDMEEKAVEFRRSGAEVYNKA